MESEAMEDDVGKEKLELRNGGALVEERVTNGFADTNTTVHSSVYPALEKVKLYCFRSCPNDSENQENGYGEPARHERLHVIQAMHNQVMVPFTGDDLNRVINSAGEMNAGEDYDK
ncbi:hypothetical protein RJT34_24343 [Clitoria ternatea]|uniref:Uncharacterized protein n=1 Tax=Clitoria ternatea TaxID=43366 RepID=A0AAN9IL84_CLITE